MNPFRTIRQTAKSALTALLTAVLTGFSVIPTLAQDSAFLQDPDLFLDYVTTNADFWRGVHDATYGGFYTNVSREGTVISSWGTDKDVLTQSRDAYAMVRAFQMTGDESYLDLARSALDFMYEHGWDATYGGWYNDLTRTGSVQNVNATKTAFFQHYALLGPVAFAEATGDSTDWEWIHRSWQHNEDVFWDDSETSFGYVDRTNRAGSSKAGKSFNATVDALTTHALQLQMMTKESKYSDRLVELGDNVLRHLQKQMDANEMGFAENYDINWNVDESETLTIMGHVLKTAWVLSRLNHLMPDERYLPAAQQMADHVLEKGYDHEYGGPYKDYNRVTGEMQLWGIADTTKAWWQMEQAITGGLELYRTTGEQRYLDMADETISFFMEWFQDPVYGEVYSDRTRYGAGIPQWGNHKGDGYKAAYHSIELGYYGYLMGSLFVQKRPAILHYRFASEVADRIVQLSPLEDYGGDYVIVSVTKDGIPYPSYDPSSRSLTLPAGISGTFRVTFSPASTVATDNLPNESFSLSAPWPNPASHSSRVELTLSHSSVAEIRVLDLLGRVLWRGTSDQLPAGTHRFDLPVQDWAAGVYMIDARTSHNRATKALVVTR